MHIIHRPIVEMREKPKGESRVVSQALFGEEIQVKDRFEDWFLIATPDEYEGWVQEGSFIALSKPYRRDLEITRLSAHLYSTPDTEYGPILTLPHGSPLKVLDLTDARWIQVELPNGKKAYVQKGDLNVEPFELVSFTKTFLGLPYTWGGRSSFGYDCSGFVQMVYRRQGINLPRDARQQILVGKTIAIEQMKGGDLIFWGKSESDIRHVGIYLENGEFIHASSRENRPYLRMSRLTDQEWSGEKEAYYPFRAARTY